MTRAARRSPCARWCLIAVLVLPGAAGSAERTPRFQVARAHAQVEAVPAGQGRFAVSAASVLVEATVPMSTRRYAIRSDAKSALSIQTDCTATPGEIVYANGFETGTLILR